MDLRWDIRLFICRNVLIKRSLSYIRPCQKRPLYFMILDGRTPSVHWFVFSIVRNTLSTVGGYHQYIGGCCVVLGGGPFVHCRMYSTLRNTIGA